MGTIDGKSKNKKDKTFMIPLIAIIVLIILLYVSWYIGRENNKVIDDWDNIEIEQEKIDEGWLITVSEAHKAWTDRNSGFPLSEVWYILTNNSGNFIEDINGKYDENETIIFFDNNNDQLMNIGDTFIINDNSDNVNSGYVFIIFSSTTKGSIILI